MEDFVQRYVVGKHIAFPWVWSQKTIFVHNEKRAPGCVRIYHPWKENIAPENGWLEDIAPENGWLEDIAPENGWLEDIAPENGWLEDYFPFGEAYFQVLC